MSSASIVIFVFYRCLIGLHRKSNVLNLAQQILGNKKRIGILSIENSLDVLKRNFFSYTIYVQRGRLVYIIECHF